MNKEEIEKMILAHLEKENISNSIQWAEQRKVANDLLDAVLKSLLVAGYVQLKNHKLEIWKLSQWVIKSNQGQFVLEHGSPQIIIYHKIAEEGRPKQQIQYQLDLVSADIYKYGFGVGMRKKYYRLEDNLLKKNQVQVVEEDQPLLEKISQGNAGQIPKEKIKDLKSKKTIDLHNLTFYQVSKGKHYRPKKINLAPQLTSEMILKKNWHDQEFRPYNLDALGTQIHRGCMHPLMQMSKQIKQILISMGFQQMTTNQYVQSEFWNFDSLFVPQMHPARESQDTFFISDPVSSSSPEEAYLLNVKKVHQQGGYGSLGYGYKWSRDISLKNILRTHTTADSAKVLFRLSKEKDYSPKKYFSIDRVFRNQTLDTTHLAQFHQVQGFVLDKDLGLAHLKGIITLFFNKIGIRQLWFKPAYNPYTEPSMQIYGYHPILRKKIEIGNSGIFRPQMMEAMGFPPEIKVIAWGLSLQRPTMIQLGLSNIRELIGPCLNLGYLQNTKLFCFE